MKVFIQQKWRLLLIPFVFWTAFIVFDLLKAWHFQVGATQTKISFFAQLSLLISVYYSWMVIVVGVGFKTEQVKLNSSVMPKFWLKHLLASVIIALFHLAWITASFWIFTPGRMAQASFSLVFIEQIYKWLLFEVIIYFVTLAYWHWLLFKPAIIALGNEKLEIKTTDGLLKCSTHEIDWLMADGNYVLLYCLGEIHKTRSTLSAMEKLMGSGFFRSHRSALVRLNKVSKVSTHRLTMEDGHKLPLSYNNKSTLQKLMLLN